MKIVGLTGGISSGKSTVSSYLKQLKIPVIDADEVARKVVEPNSQGAIEIRKAFGSDVFEEDGSLNRQKLGALIFSNAENRQKLDDLLQPLIKIMILDEIEEYRQKGETMIVLDLPLLFEKYYEELCEEIIVVYIPKELQLERLMRRNQYTKQEALSRIDSQLSIEEKRKRATVLLDNQGTIQQLYQQVEQWLVETKNDILQ
ncbi:MAG: dephospho-CoA kinase [Granulicatella sp.]|nr:MAG: dephospho-CoA kinase [Granulicatella sp.]RKW29285.1 MAG: dephospho-CoA kinase [Granulicatella sp.]